MAAVQNMTAFCDERGEKFLGICRPPNSTVLILVRIFLQRARTEDGGSRETPRLSLCLDWTVRRSLVELGQCSMRRAQDTALRPLPLTNPIKRTQSARNVLSSTTTLLYAQLIHRDPRDLATSRRKIALSALSQLLLDNARPSWMTGPPSVAIVK